MMKIGLLVLSLFACLTVTAQHSFKGKIDSYMRRDVNLCSQFGDESKLIETAKSDLNGAFNFDMGTQPVGLYRVYLDNEEYFDIIYSNEDVEINTRVENPAYNMIILRSEENAQLYEYIIENYIYDYKIDVLTQLTEIYPDGKFHNYAEKELAKEKRAKNKNLFKVIKSNKDSFAGKYLTYLKDIPVPSGYNEVERIQYLRKEYLKHFEFDDLGLLNSNAYQTVVLNYFKLFKSNDAEIYYNAGKDLLEHVFFKDPKVISAVFEYILTGFESLGLDEPAARLSLEYGSVCTDDDGSLKMRIKSNTELSVGKTAPDFIVETTRGNSYTLSEMQSDYTLIIFWATWCDHCHITLPRLAAAMSLFNQAKIDIVAVSIDSDKALLDEYLVENPLPWNVVCEYNGWDGKVVIDYAVFATPSMYLVDKNMKIVAKPYNEERLYDELEKILTEKL
jgi:thiol-disulfide isomerase/thioredoxin